MNAPAKDRAAVSLFVCVSCRGPDAEADRPGRRLFEALAAHGAGHADPAISVVPVECLSVCKRPCTVALAASGKWTYVFGDLDHATHLGDLLAMAERYRQAPDGIVPWRERPGCFRKGVVARVPPIGRP